MKSLLLIDGTNFLYRAYHGLPDLRTSSGEPTGAIKGFYNMLGMLKSKLNPDYAVCIFDAKGPTFRNELYPAYKANRPPMPDDLRLQAGPVRELVRLLGLPLLEVPGIETDDVIGTLSALAQKKNWKVYIASGDKDMAQLVDVNTLIVNTMTHTILDPEGVKDKFGVPPERIIDYLALMGDAVDNVPGIDKCGPKTAAKWLNEYGSLDEVVRRAPEMKGKIGEHLREGIPFLPLAKKLVTIKRDADTSKWLKGGLESLVPGAPSEEELEAFFRRYQMRSSMKKAQKKAAPAALPESGELFSMMGADGAVPGRIPAQDGPIADESPLQALRASFFTENDTDRIKKAASGAKAVTLDLFTEGGEGFVAKALAFAIGASSEVFVTRMALPLPAGSASALKEILLSLSGMKVVTFGLKRVSHALMNAGLPPVSGDDIEIMSYVAEAHLKHDLAGAALRLGIDAPNEEEVLGKGASAKKIEDVPDTELLGAFEKRSRALRSLYVRYLADENAYSGYRQVYESIEKPLVRVLFTMERNGVYVDTFFLAKQSADLGARMRVLEEEVYALAGEKFNLSSPKQLSEALFTHMGLPVPPKTKKTASGGYSTSEDVLSILAEDYPVAKSILEYRRLSKLKSTYTDKLPVMVSPVDGRIHTEFSQTTAVTGRLASSNPNLQNIPIRTEEGRLVREAFAGQGDSMIVSADYSQIELRIMAHLSGDEGLISAFQKGMDIHKATAAEVFGIDPESVTPDQRRTAKVINFGLIYGMSAFGLSSNLGIDTRRSQMYIDRYFERYPKVAAFMGAMRAMAHRDGYVSTAFGRRLYLPDISSSKAPVRQAAERQAINAPMQGTAADLIKMAMTACERWIESAGLQTKLVLQVHDELVLEVPPSEVDLVKEKVPEIMAGVAKLSVPLVAQVGCAKNWEAAH